jgi:hypothetical protein
VGGWITAFLANVEKNATDTLTLSRSVRRRKYEPQTESSNSQRQKKERQVKNKVKSILIIVFDIKGGGGFFAEHSSWQAKQSIPHTTVTFYGDCLKMCEDFAPNFGD